LAQAIRCWGGFIIELSSFTPMNNVDKTDEIEIVQVDSPQKLENLFTDILDTEKDTTNRGTPTVRWMSNLWVTNVVLKYRPLGCEVF